MNPLAPAWARTFVRFALRHGRALWLFALLLAIPATARTVGLYLRLEPNVEALLPRDAPSVAAMDELRARLQGVQHLGVLVDVGSPDNLPAGETLLDDLALRLRSYPRELVRRVRVGPGEEHAFLEQHGALYLDLADLKTIRERLEARRDYEVAKAADLLLDDDGPPPVDLHDLEQKYKARAGAQGDASSERFSSQDQHATLLLIEVGDGAASGDAAKLLQRVKADLQSLGGPEHYAPGMRVGFTGDVAISVEETEALMEDLSVSTVIVLVAVLGAIALYFRWIWSLAVLLPPLLLATVFAFGLASLPPFGVTELSSNTAFLGSIIVGNGVNFGIILLARYAEERRAKKPVEDALLAAVWGARAGTLVAALAAGAAYASLSLTEFRGFRQFGFIGGIGMLASWLCAFLLMPSLIAWLDRGPRALPIRTSSEGALMGRLAKLVVARPLAIVMVACALTGLAILELRSFGPEQIEYDLSRLRRADTWTNGEGYWGARMDALLGSYLTPTVILADSAAGAESIAAKLRLAATQPPLDAMVGEVRTLADVLPAEQPAKLAEINAVYADLTPRIRRLLPESERAFVNRMVRRGPATSVSLDELPETFTIGMRERDGSTGRTVLVYPKPSKELWVGPSIQTFVDGLRSAAAADGGRVAGSLPLSADIFHSLGRDGPLATALAFASVALLVLAIFRGGKVALAILATLVVSVVWLAGLAMALQVKLNFTNFIAFPITFGIGVDYAVNVMSRFTQDKARDVAAAVRSTGGAVALCSLTTIIGYSSLLLAQNRALYLFGLLAVLGEVACLTTAVVVLPAVLSLEKRRALEENNAIEGRGKPPG